MSLISYGGALCVCHNFYALIFLSLLVLPFDEIQKGETYLKTYLMVRDYKLCCCVNFIGFGLS